MNLHVHELHKTESPAGSGETDSVLCALMRITTTNFLGYPNNTTDYTTSPNADMARGATSGLCDTHLLLIPAGLSATT